MENNVNIVQNTESVMNSKDPTIYSKIQHGNNITQSVGSKILLFIKTHPFYFSLIVVGTCLVIATAVAVPVALSNNNKNDDNNNNEQNNADLNYQIMVLSDSQKNTILEINDNIGTKDDSDLEVFCNYLKEESNDLNDYQKVYLTYYWVAHNIAYDAATYLAHGTPDCNPSSFFSSKLTVCSGYARLFTHLLKCMNYPEENIKNIVGYAKGYGFNQESELTETNHEWNAVKINEKWCLIDTTWGAGSISGTSFNPSYSEYYLCTPPEQLIRTHLPQESQSFYQLLEPEISKETFRQSVKTKTGFFETGFYKITNDLAIQNICGHGSITLNYKGETRPILYTYMKKGNDIIENVIMNQRINGGYIINFYINEASTYELDISAKKDKSSNSYSQMATITIKCNTEIEEANYYPHFYTNYENLDNIEVINPIQGCLEQGHKYNFKIKAPGYDSFSLFMSGESIKMYKSGDYFKADNVLIHGSYVNVECVKDNFSYGTIFEYLTKGTPVEFPTVYSNNLNIRLESPLKSSLIRGSTETFTIICDTVETFKIIYKNPNNADVNTLFSSENFTKVGNTYSLTLTIESSESYTKLYLGYRISSGNSYSMIYCFDLINNSVSG